MSDAPQLHALMAEIGRQMSAPTAAVCAQVARQIEQVESGSLPWPDVRVALVASFTIEPLAPFVSAYGAQSGILVRTYVAGGDHWTQEAADPASGLRQFQPDVIIAALELEDLSPALLHDYLDLDAAAVDAAIAQTIERVRGFVDYLRAWSQAKILLHTFPLPPERSLGVFDPMDDRGQTQALRQLDARLRSTLSATRDVYFIDVERLIAAVGYQRWHDARMWTLARLPYTSQALDALAREYLRYLRAFTGRVRKVLALDLDDTLWGGTVGEEGREGLHLGVDYKGRAFAALQRVLRQLSRRGVLLAINSKNNPDDALDVIAHHPGMLLRRDDFAAVRINWQDKAANLVELSEELDLSLDSFVFVDDSAAECERIRQALPEVLTLQLSGDPATYAETIRSLGVFDTLSFADEDRARTAMYRGEAQRRSLQQAMGSLEDFYRSLEMQLEIQPVSRETLARAAALTQRTNQFNLTTKRFSQDELSEYLAHPAHEGFVFRLSDRFGDHGLIGLALLERQGPAMVIDTLLLSCRVLKRTVEETVLSFLCGRAREAGAETIEGRFKPTRKNAPAASLYVTYGFARDGEVDGAQRFVRRASDALPVSPFIVCQRPERRHA